jgi:hypothetical protein
MRWLLLPPRCLMQRPCSWRVRPHGFEPFDAAPDLTQQAGLNSRCAQLCDEDIGGCCASSAALKTCPGTDSKSLTRGQPQHSACCGGGEARVRGWCVKCPGARIGAATAAGYCFCNSTWKHGHELAPPDAPPGQPRAVLRLAQAVVPRHCRSESIGVLADTHALSLQAPRRRAAAARWACTARCGASFHLACPLIRTSAARAAGRPACDGAHVTNPVPVASTQAALDLGCRSFPLLAAQEERPGPHGLGRHGSRGPVGPRGLVHRRQAQVPMPLHPGAAAAQTGCQQRPTAHPQGPAVRPQATPKALRVAVMCAVQRCHVLLQDGYGGEYCDQYREAFCPNQCNGARSAAHK